MFNIPKRVRQRLIHGIKMFQKILTDPKNKNLNEADTVNIVLGVFADMLGYARYTEISAELKIKGTYCDLCIKIGKKIQLLIEAKSIKQDLKANYRRQAVNYAANKGIEWVMLTNGLVWEVYKVFFDKPIDQELVLRIDFSKISHKNESDLNELYVLTKEGMVKSSLKKYFIQKRAISKYYIGAIILNSSILRRIKKQIKRISPAVKVNEDQIKEVIETEVLKQEILESEKYKEALRAVNRVRKHKTKTTQDDELIAETTTKEKPASI